VRIDELLRTFNRKNSRVVASRSKKLTMQSVDGLS